MTNIEPHNVVILSTHKSEAAARRAMKRASQAYIIHEPMTHVTNERWLVAIVKAGV